MIVLFCISSLFPVVLFMNILGFNFIGDDVGSLDEKLKSFKREKEDFQLEKELFEKEREDFEAEKQRFEEEKKFLEKELDKLDAEKFLLENEKEAFEEFLRDQKSAKEGQ